MKVKNRLRCLYVLLALFATVFLIGSANASALTKNIKVTDIAVKEKSGTITVLDPTISDNEISSNITFYKIDDFVTFELSLKNEEAERYKIESIEDNNTNNNIQIDYSYSGDFIDAGGVGAVTIKLAYKNTLKNVDKISINDLTIKIYLVNEDGKSDEIIINPTTSDALPYYLALFAVASIVLIIVLKNKRIRGIKVCGILIALSVLLIPLATLAKEKYEVQIKFTNIDIIGEFEVYNITIDPGNGEATTTVQVKYGDKIPELPANPSKDGYDFEKWVDDNGNEVMTDTVITGPISVKAKYTAKKYNITYDLNGGSLPDGKTNPSEYTIEDEITINNPTKQGYTFIGWSGTGIDGKTTSLVIPAGSKDDRSYVANYSANEHTPYTVTHRYQNLNDLSTYTEVTVTEYGETGKTIPAPRQERTGFETPAVQNVTVKGDESSHITYTYDRKTYSYSVTDRTYLTDDSTSNGTYPYGTSITAKAQERDGYTFAWDDGDTNYERTFELTGATSLTPVYTAKTNTPYVVKHYKQKLSLDSYELADTQNLTGTTDAPIEPAVNTYTGFKSPAVQHTTIAGNGSTEVIYNYDREMYSFSFNNNENVTSTKPADNYPYGTVITLTANDVAGKAFSKWSNNETANPLTITLTGDLTIEPIYVDNTVTVTFETNGGSEVDSQTVTIGSKATRPAEDPTKYNQLFYDWYTTDSYETVFDFNTNITTDTTIYARFVPSSFPTVFEHTGECIFNGSGGVLEGENCDYADGTNKYIDTGIQLYSSANHKKDYEIGFTIVSYNSENNVRQATFMNTKLEGNNFPGLVFRKFDNDNQLDLSSRRTKTDNSRQKFDNKDGERTVKIYRITNKTTKVQEIFYSIDGEEKVKINDLSEFNPVFGLNVWFGAAPTNVSASGAQRYLVGTLSNMYIKLGAYEEPEGLTYTVSLDANGGSVSPASITKDKGDAVGELPTPTDIPAGKTFDGWYTDLSEEGEKVDSSYTPNTSTTIYAKYNDTTTEFTVTFDTDGGSSIASQTVTYGDKATRPSTNPTKESYIFDDWYTTNDYSVKFDFENVGITKNTIIYARFIIDSCKGFNTDSWDRIKNNVENDPNYYPLGCKKNISMDANDNGVDEEYKLVIVNRSNCSTNISESGCGFVLQFDRELSITLRAEQKMKNSKTNSGGWPSTNVYNFLNNVIYERLPNDLKSVVRKTKTISGHGLNDAANYVSMDDKLFLLSAKEVGDPSTQTDYSSTRLLDYYSEGEDSASNSKRAYMSAGDGTLNDWWLRTPQRGSAFNFLRVDSSGKIFGLNANNDNPGIIPALRIGSNPTYTVSFETDGGSGENSQTIEYGEKASRPSTDPTKEGYIFDNWYTSDGYGELFDFDNTKIYSDTTIYAHFIDQCRDFSTASWSTIKDNLESDPNYYPVGCEKEVELDMNDDSEPESYTVRLANTSTPEVCSTEGYSQTACGIVIDFVDTVTSRRMNSTSTNIGGWTTTELVLYLNNDFYNKLPEDLRSVIIPTYPIVSGSGKNDTSSDITAEETTKNMIYLLSEKEVVASIDYDHDNKHNYTRTIDYFAAIDASHIKRRLSGQQTWWWLRTAYSNDTRHFFYINNTGQPDIEPAQFAVDVAPAFRIGTMPDFSVSFNTDGGSEVASQTITYGGKATRPSTDPTRAGYSFDNWYTSDSYGTLFDFDNTVITSNTTIYAKWGESSRKATDIIARQVNNLGDYTINFTKKAIVSDDIATANGNGVNKYKENGADVYYYRGQINNNNVIWADKCWKIVRTTATGGTKMIYNGLPSDVAVDGETAKQCNATGVDSQITVNVNGTDTNTFKFNNNNGSPADVGYMYGTRIQYSSLSAGSTSFVFSNNVSRSGNTYTLDTSTGQSISGTWTDERTNAAVKYHYFCTDGTTSCDNTKIGYIHYFGARSTIHYLKLDGYDSIEAAKTAMFTNTTDSNAKAMVETWFEQQNLNGHIADTKNYEDDLEDAVFCNDRTYYSGALKGKDSDAGTSASYHGAYGRNAVKNAQNNYEPSLDCTNSNDAFTKDGTNGNGKLSHKIGLITADELTLAGTGWSGYDTTAYLYTGQIALSASSGYFDDYDALEFRWGSFLGYSVADNAIGLRPLVSLKSGIEFASGTGSTADPYIVE